MTKRRHFRIWVPGVVERPVCHRYTVVSAFATAAWLAAKHDSDYSVTDEDQGLAWTVTRDGRVR